MLRTQTPDEHVPADPLVTQLLPVRLAAMTHVRVAVLQVYSLQSLLSEVQFWLHVGDTHEMPVGDVCTQFKEREIAEQLWLLLVVAVLFCCCQ